MQHYEYVRPIINWAEDKGILSNGRLTKQLLKSTEECLELQVAIESYENDKNKVNLLNIKDAIGDIYVTLVVSVKMTNKFEDVEELFGKYKQNVKVILNGNYRKLIEDLKFSDRLIWTLSNGKEHQIMHYLGIYIKLLKYISKFYHLELEDCIELAYNTIKERKGQMIDGSFVKNATNGN